MKKAVPLQRGSAVRIVAPSSSFDRTRFEQGLSALESLGLRPEVPDAIFSRSDYLAGEDDVRLSGLINALEDPQVTAIWCARGGYGATRLLPRLAQVKPSGPKLLVGFSDISALIALWFERWGMTSVHGPMVCSLAEEPEESRQHLWRIVSGQGSGLNYSIEPGYQGPTILGHIYASNLSLLAHLIGTPYLPDLAGSILAVEEVGERPYRVDRLLTQVRQANLLAGVSALIIGKLEGCDEGDGSILVEAALQRGLADVSVPILRGHWFGHSAPNLALPVGVKAKIDAQGLTLLEEVTDSPARA